MSMNFHPGAMGLRQSLVKGATVAGIDQRFGNWDVAILDACRVQADMVIPRLIFYAKVQDYETVHQVMTSYRATCAVGDCRPEAGDMMRLQKMCVKSRIAFYRAQYSTVMSNVPMTINAKESLLTLERTMTLDEVFFAVSTGIGLALPQNFKDICDGAFVHEMCASNRAPVIRHGEQWAAWTEGQIPDHAFHALGYALVAYKMAKLDRRSDGIALMAEKGEVSRTIDEELSQEYDDVDVACWDDEGKRTGVGVILEG